jgi:hypothetical protein
VTRAYISGEERKSETAFCPSAAVCRPPPVLLRLRSSCSFLNLDFFWVSQQISLRTGVCYSCSLPDRYETQKYHTVPSVYGFTVSFSYISAQNRASAKSRSQQHLHQKSLDFIQLTLPCPSCLVCPTPPNNTHPRPRAYPCTLLPHTPVSLEFLL